MKQFSKTRFIPKLLSVLSSGYGFTNLRADVLAGLTVAVVALPLAMALGIASGASPEKGLMTAIVAGLLISLFGGSRIQIGGPTGAFVVVVFNVIARHGYEGLLLATLLAGLILIMAGYARFGKAIKFIPLPVVTGFTTGIAVIIASTQVREFLGLRIDNVPAEFIPKWKAYCTAFDTMSLPTFFVGLSALFIIILFRKFAPRWPGYLIVLVSASLVVVLFNIPVETVGSQFPGISSGITLPHLPSFSLEQIKSLLPSAFTIAFLAGIESLLSAVVADGMTGFKHRPNQELVGQGIANIGSALFGGLPATGAIARTATNIAAGGRTPIAGIFHAVFILFFVLFGTDLMKFIPMTVLAAILFLVAWGMSEVHHFIRIFRLSSIDRLILVLTFLLTIFVDLTVAIGVGVITASLLFMARMSKSVEIFNGPKKLENSKEAHDQRSELPSGVEVFWIAGPIFFGVAGALLNVLKRIGCFPKVLIIRMRLVPYLDATGAAALIDLAKQCHTKKTTVIFSSIQKQPAKILSRFLEGDSEVHVEYTSTYEDAISLARKIVNEAEAANCLAKEKLLVLKYKAALNHAD